MPFAVAVALGAARVRSGRQRWRRLIKRVRRGQVFLGALAQARGYGRVFGTGRMREHFMRQPAIIDWIHMRAVPIQL